MVPSKGIEPMTYALRMRCSAWLSYDGIVYLSRSLYLMNQVSLLYLMINLAITFFDTDVYFFQKKGLLYLDP